VPRKAKKTADEYTRAELYARAERKGIKYRSRMNKQQLFEALGLGRTTRKRAAAGKAAPAKATAKTRARSRTGAETAASKSSDGKPAGKPAGKVAPKRKAAARKAPAKKKAPAGTKAKTTATARRRSPAGSAPRKVAARKKPAAAGLEPVAAEPLTLPAGSVVPPPALKAAATAYVDRGPKLPEGYGDDRLVALVRDPRCIFTYWELGGGGHQRVHDELGGDMTGTVWVLRLIKVAGDRFFDVPIDPVTGNWYLHVEPSERYQVRIGIVLPSGVFREIAASAEVVTPAERVSDVVDEEWMLVREEFDRLVEEILSGRAPGGVGSSEVLQRLSNLPRRMQLFSGSITSPRGGR